MIKLISIAIIILLSVYFIMTMSENDDKKCSDIVHKMSSPILNKFADAFVKEKETSIYTSESSVSGTSIIPDWALEIEDINGNTSRTVHMFQSGSHSRSKISVGTGNSCDIRIACKGSFYVGRVHAFIVIKNGYLYIVDNDSKNRTFDQHHEPIKSVQIYEGAVVYLSDLIALRFHKVTAREFCELLKSDFRIKII